MAEADEHNRGPHGWVRVLLFVSLALNFLIVCALAGFLLKGQHAHHGVQRNDPVLPYTRAFQPEQRRDLWRALRQSLPREGAGLRDRYLSDYALALELLRSTPFDATRMEALLADQVARGTEIRSQGQKVLAAYLDGMNADERRAYADRLEQELIRMRQRGVREGGRGRPEGETAD